MTTFKELLPHVRAWTRNYTIISFNFHTVGAIVPIIQVQKLKPEKLMWVVLGNKELVNSGARTHTQVCLTPQTALLFFLLSLKLRKSKKKKKS